MAEGQAGETGHRDHERRAEREAPPVRCGVITVSDTRTPETDTSGAAIRELLEGGGHTVARYALAKDEPAQIVALVREMAAAGCQVILSEDLQAGRAIDGIKVVNPFL